MAPTGPETTLGGCSPSFRGARSASRSQSRRRRAAPRRMAQDEPKVFDMTPATYQWDETDGLGEDVCFCSEDEVEVDTSAFLSGLAWRLATASAYLDDDEVSGGAIDSIVDDLADWSLAAVVGATTAEEVTDEVAGKFPESYAATADSKESVGRDLCYCVDEEEMQASHGGPAMYCSDGDFYRATTREDLRSFTEDLEMDAAPQFAVLPAAEAYACDGPSPAPVDAAECCQDAEEFQEDWEADSEDGSAEDSVSDAEDAPPVPEEEEGADEEADTPESSRALQPSRSQTTLRTMAAPVKRTVYGGVRRVAPTTPSGWPTPKAGRALAQALTMSSSIRMDADDVSGSDVDRESSLVRGYEALGVEIHSMDKPRRKSSTTTPKAHRSLVQVRSAPDLKPLRALAPAGSAMAMDLGFRAERQRSQPSGLYSSSSLPSLVPYSSKSFSQLPSLAPQGSKAWKTGGVVGRMRPAPQRVLL